MNQPAPDSTYIGRFAPSPTGPLHIGSLLTAVASYADAKAHGGQWLVRMEDLDPPREMAGAADRILETLQHFGLHWDGDVLYQSRRQARYQSTVQQLLDQGLAYYCTCSRAQIQARSGSNTYPGTCRGCSIPPLKPHAIRLQVKDADIHFEDALQGPLHCNLQQQGGDFVIQRKDHLYAYHLAVVLDDADQGITHIVRGCDLLESTFAHWHLQTVLSLPHPHYAHLPVIVNADGQKLSKQTHAEPVPLAAPAPYLMYCLQTLGQQPPATLNGASAHSILQWACEHWQLERVPPARYLPQQQIR